MFHVVVLVVFSIANTQCCPSSEAHHSCKVRQSYQSLENGSGDGFYLGSISLVALRRQQNVFAPSIAHLPRNMAAEHSLRGQCNGICRCQYPCTAIRKRLAHLLERSCNAPTTSSTRRGSAPAARRNGARRITAPPRTRMCCSMRTTLTRTVKISVGRSLARYDEGLWWPGVLGWEEWAWSHDFFP